MYQSIKAYVKGNRLLGISVLFEFATVKKK